MRSGILLTMLASIGIAVVACKQGADSGVESAAKPATDTGTVIATKPVVVYVSAESGMDPDDLFARFHAETGIAVIVKSGESTNLTNLVMEHRGSPPADVLLSPSISDISRAADDGALRPYAPTAAAQIPAALHDPDNMWFAIAYRAADLVYSPGSKIAGDSSSYTMLADTKFKNKLCLSSSLLPINRAVIAGMIADSSVAETERVVRGWVANLAKPAFNSEHELLAAIAAGACEVGIASSLAVSQWQAKNPGGNVGLSEPEKIAVGVNAVGVARHATNPDGAETLINWLLSAPIQMLYAKATGNEAVIDVPTSTASRLSDVSRTGWHEQDAGLLVMRAAYR